MWVLWIFWGIVGFIVYRALTKDKREAAKQKYAATKLSMQSDYFYTFSVGEIQKLILDLKGPFVQLLRSGGTFWLIFKEGSVYAETRWTEKVGDTFQNRKETKCILNRIALGKNPLSCDENNILAEMVLDSLSEVKWLQITKRGYGETELRITKHKDFMIPEAF